MMSEVLKLFIRPQTLRDKAWQLRMTSTSSSKYASVRRGLFESPMLTRFPLKEGTCSVRRLTSVSSSSCDDDVVVFVVGGDRIVVTVHKVDLFVGPN